MLKQSEDLKKKYWNGSTNKFIRYYFYSQRGLALFNEFRYLFMLIFGIYITFKLTNPIYLVGMFLISTPLLILVGYVSVHYVSKVMDWLSVEFSTHFGRYSYTLLEAQLEKLGEILNELKRDKQITD